MNKKILTRLDELSSDTLSEDFKELVEMVIPYYNIYASEIRGDYIYENDEDVINEVLRGFSPNQIINQIVYGDFIPNRPFFVFDGYDNLKSLMWADVYDLYLTDNDFVDWFLNNEE